MVGPTPAGGGDFGGECTYNRLAQVYCGARFGKTCGRAGGTAAALHDGCPGETKRNKDGPPRRGVDGRLRLGALPDGYLASTFQSPHQGLNWAEARSRLKRSIPGAPDRMPVVGVLFSSSNMIWDFAHAHVPQPDH